MSSPPGGSTSRRNITVAVLAVLALLVTMAAIKLMRDAPVAGPGGSGGGPGSMPPAPVYVETVTSEVAQAEAMVTGTLRAVSAAELAAREAGAVMEVLVNEGDVVAANDVIVRLDTRRVTALLAEARAALASAKGLAVQRKAESDRAGTDLAMKRGLVERKAVSQSDVLDAEKVLAVAAAQSDVAADGIEEAQSRVSFLELQLEDLTIRAPFGGVIVERRVEPGEWVAAGAAVASLVTIDPIEAWLQVPSRYLDQLAADSEHFRVRRSSSGQEFDPETVEVVPRVESLSQLFTVVATLRNPDGRLAPGESVTGIVPVGRREPHWRFSRDAVLQTATGDFVQVVVKPAEEGSLPGARRVGVGLAFERGDRAYVPVSAGVFVEGDQVIVEGNERLLPGQPLLVRLRDQTGAEPEAVR